MKRIGFLVVVILFGLSGAMAGQRDGVDVNKLANFITIKEYMHCAQYSVAVVKRTSPNATQRAKNIDMAGAFIGAALQLDEDMTKAAARHAERYVATLAAGELDTRYRKICLQLHEAGRIRSRKYTWRYRLNGGAHVPAAFFKKRWEGQLPTEWYQGK